MKLVLIPPLGHDQKFYDALVSLLPGKEILRLDYPYFDQSFPWESEDLINELAHYFSRMIDQHPEVNILGVSLGATLSLRIKEILGTKVRHLFMVSSGGHKVASFRKEMILSHMKTQGQETFLLNALEVGSTKEFSESEFRLHFHHDLTFPKAYWKHFTEVLWSKDHRRIGSPHLMNLVKASVEVNFEELLSHFQKDITIIWGEQDKVFSMRFYEKFKKLCKESQFYLYENVGHFSPLETPEKIKDILLGYEKTL